MPDRFTGLWQHPDFLKLWGAQTISVTGSEVTVLALPLTAALVLGASAAQMGFLLAAGMAPNLLFGLVAGVWADRVRRRPILVAADLGRGVLLLAVPLAAWAGALRIELLYAVAFLVGSLTVFFDVSYGAYLPALLRRDQLNEGNSKLEASYSTSLIAGPGLGGLLVSLVGAPFAVFADALTFFVSAATLGAIRAREPAPAPPAGGGHIGREIGEGLRLVLSNRILRAIAGSGATANLANAVQMAVLVLFATSELGVGPAGIGLAFAVASVGGVIAAVTTERITERFALGLLTAGLFLDAVANTVWMINLRTLRQVVTPHHLRGRAGGTGQFITWGVIPLGALLGGALGSAIGLRATLLVAAVGMGLPMLWIWFSPIAKMRELPPMPDEEGEGEDLGPELSEVEVPLPARPSPVGLVGTAGAVAGPAERG